VSNTFCLFVTFSFLLSAPALYAADLINGIRVIVQEAVITRQELETRSRPFLQDLYNEYRDRPEMFQQKRAELEAQRLDELIERQLILHDFEKTGYKLPQSVIDDAVEERIRRGSYGEDRSKLIKSLQAQGLTFEMFRQQVKESFIIDQMRLLNASADVIISPYKIETYYQAHMDEFQVEDQIKVRMIVLNRSATEPERAARLAREIRGKIKEGATFSEMATIHSDGRAIESQWWKRSERRADLYEAAAALAVGEASDVIETPEACYILLVDEKRPAHTQPLKEVRAIIEQNMLREARAHRTEDYVNGLKKVTFIRYF